MAMIELQDTLPDHPKTLAASEALKIDKDLLVGKLCRLWTWCLNQRENGFIAEYEIGTVAEVMRWNKKPDVLFKALSAAPPGFQYGFLERVEGGYVIHDWDERVEMIREKREERRAQTRERVRRFRDKKGARGLEADNMENKDQRNEGIERNDRQCNAENGGIMARCNAENNGCNALHERYETQSVTPSNATASSPSPFPPAPPSAPSAPSPLTLPVTPVTPVTPSPTISTPSPAISSIAPEKPKMGEAAERRFDTFWDFYPKKVGKIAAKKAFGKIRMDEVLFKRILAAITVQKRSAQWLENNGQYIPNPATWLNRGSWDDEIIEGRGKNDRYTREWTPAPPSTEDTFLGQKLTKEEQEICRLLKEQ
jgi:hypothetical protein